MLLAPLDKSSDSGRGRVKDGDAVTLDDVPKTIERRVIRSPLIHHDRRAVRERAVDNITMAGHPADIGRTPINILVLKIKYQARRVRRLRQVAARRVQYPFWLTG